MKSVIITNFGEAILFELQQKLQNGDRGEMSFHEIWKACETAGPNFMVPIDPWKNRKSFVAQMFDYVRRLELEGKINIVSILQDRIDRIILTEWGNQYLGGVVFIDRRVTGR